MAGQLGDRASRRRSRARSRPRRCAPGCCSGGTRSRSRGSRGRGCPGPALTPFATPTISIGTLTVTFTSIRTRTKSMCSGLARDRVPLHLPDHGVAALVGARQLQEEDRVLAGARRGRGPRGPSGRPRWARWAFPRRRRRPGSARRRGCAGPRSFQVVERFSTASSMVFMAYPARKRRAKRRILHKKRGNGSPIVDPLDGLPQEGGHGQGPDPGAAGHGRLDRDGVGDQQGLQARSPRSAPGPAPRTPRGLRRRRSGSPPASRSAASA